VVPVLEVEVEEVLVVGPPALPAEAASAMPSPAKPTPARINVVLPSIWAFFTPAGLPEGSVVAANAFVTNKLAARRAVPMIRIVVSIKKTSGAVSFYASLREPVNSPANSGLHIPKEDSPSVAAMQQ
jgi:hypothetical protein